MTSNRLTTHPRRQDRRDRAAERADRTPAERIAALAGRSAAGYSLRPAESLSLDLGEYVYATEDAR